MKYGTIEGICGPMFSGKTEELLRRIRRAEIAGQEVLVLKPRIDDRYELEMVCSHAGSRRASELVGIQKSDVDGIAVRGLRSSAQVIGLEEVQFLPSSIVGACRAWQQAGKRVIWTGLDMDSTGTPFGPVPQLMAVGAVLKLTAVCVRCGGDATHTHRRVSAPSQDQVVVGGVETYEARCFGCWMHGC